MIQAFVKFGPRLQRQPTVRLEQLAERLAELTGLRPSQVMSVLLELQSALLHYCKRGAGLELPGIGYFRPSLRGDGRMRLLYRADLTLRRALSSAKDYQGEILNSENIGLDPAGYKALWDAEFPEDPMDLPLSSAEAA
jgi:hypothetical protein